MIKNTLHYNYNATVREIYDLTHDEALKVIDEDTPQEDKYYVMIFEGISKE